MYVASKQITRHFNSKRQQSFPTRWPSFHSHLSRHSILSPWWQLVNQELSFQIQWCYFALLLVGVYLEVQQTFLQLLRTILRNVVANILVFYNISWWFLANILDLQPHLECHVISHGIPWQCLLLSWLCPPLFNNSSNYLVLVGCLLIVTNLGGLSLYLIFLLHNLKFDGIKLNIAMCSDTVKEMMKGEKWLPIEFLGWHEFLKP